MKIKCLENVCASGSALEVPVAVAKPKKTTARKK
jgi:hypothetical protein